MILGRRARRRRLQELVDSVPYWYHSIDLGAGVVTPGARSLQSLREQAEVLRLPNLEGKTFLDIGAWDGFFSFEAERRGARQVLALDHYVWAGEPGTLGSVRPDAARPARSRPWGRRTR